MVLEPEQEQSQRPQPGTVKEQGEGVEVTLNQNTAAMEICDSPSECDEEARSSPVEAEERSFVANLYCFMKDRGTPIERIPHLGFKQINLWRIYSAVEKLGGYDSVTAKRLWKNVYDELGGSPGSTSAATCTRRHYERLVLPFERQLRGEEDKPLPPSKPRKQYKRSPDGKGSKSEGKRKRNQLDKETDSEAQERLETGSHSEIGTLVPSTPWTVSSKRLHLDCPQPSHESTTGDDHSSSAYALSHLVQDTTPCPWRDPIQSVAGEVISPLEKKKRVAQASLSLSLSPRQDDCKDRPSVIHCSPSPGLLPPSRTRNPSDGSPLPVSSSSSRSPSPYSVSSEDCPAITEDKPSAPNPELPLDYSSSLNSSVCNVARKPQSCSPDVKGLAGVPGQHRDFPQVSPLPVVSIKGQTKDSVWNPVCNMSNRRTTHQPPPSSCTYTVKPCWVPSTSSFTKVHPKSVEPLRPIPHQPGYKLHQHPSRSMLLDNTLTYAKKLHMVPRLYSTEKKEKPRTILSNSLPTQQPLFHSNSSFPVSYFVPAYDRTRGDAGQQPPLHPIILPTHMIRLPQSQTNPMYRHVATGPTHSAPYEPALCSYPYPVPLWSPHTGYSITGVHSHYPHTRM